MYIADLSINCKRDTRTVVQVGNVAHGLFVVMFGIDLMMSFFITFIY